MKPNKKQLSLGLLTAITATVVPITTVISCGNNSEDIFSIKLKEFQEKHSQEMSAYKSIIANNDNDTSKVIDSKNVNLVSLGDSVSSGFTLLEGYTDHHQGYYDQTSKQVSGISYGSYLARAFQKQSILGDFNNYGIAGATTSSLANQVDPNFKMSLEELGSKRRRDLILKPDAKTAARNLKLQDKLKAATLVTISIGANDILGNLKIAGKTLTQLMDNPTSISMSGGLDKLIDFGGESHMKYVIEKAKFNLMHTISKIKSLNPNAKIVLVGYPMPINQLGPLLRAVKMDKDGERVSIASELLRMLSTISTDISKKFKTIDFIDTNVPTEWDEKSISLTPKLLDIHPGPKGYREMAAIILSELSGGAKLGKDQKLFTPKISNYGDIEKRLSKNYQSILLEYAEKDSDGKYKSTPLGAEGQAVQSKSKPTELIRFIAKIVNSLADSLVSTQSSSIDPIKMNSYSTELNPVELVSMIHEIDPFIKTVFKSAKAGYESSDSNIKKAVEQDLKYIFAKITDTLVKKIKTLDEPVKTIATSMVGSESNTHAIIKIMELFPKTKKYIESKEAGALSTFVDWIKKSPNDKQVITDVLNTGMSKFDYTK